MSRESWTEYELNRAHAMRTAGQLYGEIDKALGRGHGATQKRLNYGSKRQVKSNRVPIGLLAEREALADVRNQRTLTQDFCGDPPPGYSALHGKTGLR